MVPPLPSPPAPAAIAPSASSTGQAFSEHDSHLAVDPSYAAAGWANASGSSFGFTHRHSQGSTSTHSFNSTHEEHERRDLVHDLACFEHKPPSKLRTAPTLASSNTEESLQKPSSTLDAASSLLQESYQFNPRDIRNSAHHHRDEADNLSIVEAYADRTSHGSLASLGYAEATHHVSLEEEEDDASQGFIAQNLTTDELRELEERKRNRNLPSRVWHSFKRSFYWIPLLFELSWVCRIFLLMAVVEAVANIVFEVILFHRFQHRRAQGAFEDISATLPTFVAAFALAHVYNVVLCIDACVNKNMILVWGIVIFNAGMLVYAGIQTNEIRKVLFRGVIGNHQHTGVSANVFSILTASVIGVSLAVYLVLSYFLRKEFGGRMYRLVSASVDLRKRYVDYNLYVVLLKFDLFFFFTFCVQLIIVVLDDSDRNAERIITIVATPLSLLAVLVAQWAVKEENKPVMWVWLVGLLAGMAYFIFKLVRIWTLHSSDDPSKDIYRYTFKSLTIFAALSLATLLTTLGMALRCMWNFDRGLKMVIVRSHLSREREARKKQQVRQQKHQQHQGEPGKTDPGLELRSVA